MKQYFITGTDTEVGKTYVTSHLLKSAAMLGKSTLGYKPIAAGCDNIEGNWVNEDAASLHAASSIAVSIKEVNPIALVPPIAPHIAAKEAGVTLTAEAITAGLRHLERYSPDLLLMEGAGGWQLPLSDDTFLSDVVASLEMDVILVVGMKLGCLNHALLTAKVMQQQGVNLVGWIANDITGYMSRYDENLATLKHAMPAPLLLEIPFQQEPSAEALQRVIQKLC
ncbi:dethiobiotin synthase [Alteromonas sp.]|nr:dethiobiotin synthase [Alteromonas sp.]